MIDSILNLLFRCPHRRLTRPVTPVTKRGVPQGDTYVVCLDCGKQFSYDLQEMRIAGPVEASSRSGVLDPQRKARKSRYQYALWASALPLAWLVGKKALRSPRNPEPPKDMPPDGPKP
jgi:DNA-directed RNA polymerase subunit RPC12/RpoP